MASLLPCLLLVPEVLLSYLGRADTLIKLQCYRLSQTNLEAGGPYSFDLGYLEAAQLSLQRPKG